MRADSIKELGLSPLWVKKTAAAAQPATPTVPAATAVPPPAKPSSAAPATRIVGTDISAMNWQQLRAAAENCTQCGLCEKRHRVAFGTGDTQAKILFIGEGPGEEEDRKGEPFVGRAGKLLDLMLHAINLNRRDAVYIANVVKCRPPGNRNPSAQEIEQCLPYLQQQIKLIKPDLLVALGKIAAAHLLNTEDSIAQMRQKMHVYRGIPLVVTYHPAYLLRSPQEKRKSWDDLKFIRRFLTEHK